jgi:hypothetical protein
MKNRRIPFTTIVLVLACLDLPNTFGVVPAPDGGYPGGNTAEGTNALFSRTSGLYNTAVGLNALYADTTGGLNTALGFQTLRFNVAGTSNTAVGGNALLHNRNSYNTAVGDSALVNNTAGNQNTADGYQALFSNTTGGSNTAIGSQALFHNTTGSNTAIGAHALTSNTTGAGNTAIGLLALDNNIVGGDNTATGSQALQNNIGSINTAYGALALFHNTSGSNNIAMGYNAGSGVTTASGVICIGAAGGNVSNSCFIGNIYGKMAGFGTAVYINSSGQLGTSTCSQRFKDNIKPMDRASEVLFALKPVTFRYKKEFDPAGIPQFGLVAEDVEKVNPDLVVRDADGKVRTVRYEQINAMLLNEFLKEHRRVEAQQSKIEKQEATIAQLKSAVAKQEATAGQQHKEMEAFAAGLKVQAAQIQKVSAQLAAASPSRGGLELSKFAPQVVSDSR